MFTTTRARSEDARLLGSLTKFLAGVPATDGLDPFFEISKSIEWQRYSATLDASFEFFNTKFARPFAEWAEKFNGAHDFRGTIFYPFSGPDFLFPFLLFPQANEYILCGRERCTPNIELGFMENQPWSEVLASTTNCASHFLKHSYFLTTDLTEFAKQQVMGIFPLLIMLVGRCGLHPFKLSVIKNEKTQNINYVELNFMHSKAEKSIKYFQKDLRNSHVEPDDLLIQHLTHSEECGLFCKSASYLMHEPEFSNLLDVIFMKCKFIVQDPSSIPFKILKDRSWDVKLFGSYTGTLPVFDKYEQSDLIRAYQVDSDDLDFAIGYLKDKRYAALISARAARGQ